MSDRRTPLSSGSGHHAGQARSPPWTESRAGGAGDGRRRLRKRSGHHRQRPHDLTSSLTGDVSEPPDSGCHDPQPPLRPGRAAACARCFRHRSRQQRPTHRRCTAGDQGAADHDGRRLALHRGRRAASVVVALLRTGGRPLRPADPVDLLRCHQCGAGPRAAAVAGLRRLPRARDLRRQSGARRGRCPVLPGKLRADQGTGPGGPATAVQRPLRDGDPGGDAAVGDDRRAVRPGVRCRAAAGVQRRDLHRLGALRRRGGASSGPDDDGHCCRGAGAGVCGAERAVAHAPLHPPLRPGECGRHGLQRSAANRRHWRTPPGGRDVRCRGRPRGPRFPGGHRRLPDRQQTQSGPSHRRRGISALRCWPGTAEPVRDRRLSRRGAAGCVLLRAGQDRFPDHADDVGRRGFGGQGLRAGERWRACGHGRGDVADRDGHRPQ